MNSLWECVESKIEMMVLMMFLVRSSRLDDIFMDQEHNPMRNELGKMIKTSTKGGMFRPKKRGKKKMKFLALNTYRCRGWIKMNLEPFFLAWSLLELENRVKMMKNLDDIWEPFFLFLSLWFGRNEERKSEMECGFY